MADNAAGKQRGRPFRKGQSGNPTGKMPGTRHKATLAAESLLDGQASALSRKAIDLALGGDVTALRLCLERILPPRRDRPVAFSLPAITSVEDAARALAAVTLAVAAGELTPSEAGDIARLVEAFTRAVEAGELSRRLAEVEAMVRDKG